MWNRFKTLDLLLYLVPVVLGIISVIFIYILTVNQVGIGLALRQGIALLIGMFGMFFLTFTDYRALAAWKYWFCGFTVLSLLAVRFIGVTTFGATSWINLGFYQFEPGEFAKLLIIITLPAFLLTRRRLLGYRQFLVAGAVVGVPVVMVLLQPDFGTALILSALGLVILFHARLRPLQRLLLAVCVVVVSGAIILSFKNVHPFSGLLKDYQKNRLASFVDPRRDPRGSGYNVQQSKIAVGSGGITGQGLGLGSQSQLNFLPVVHADFIFAAIAESWGIIGSYGLLLLFLVLILRLVQAARIAQDEYGSLICLGFAGMLLFQVLINVGMNIGIMPVTGIPLPFVSYGGTALMTYCCAVGVAQSVVIRSKRLTF